MSGCGGGILSICPRRNTQNNERLQMRKRKIMLYMTNKIVLSSVNPFMVI